MNNPYISRVRIKNFRNFKDVDITLNHKQVIIGENNVGKTNFLRAIQLILDPKLSDNDRYLQQTDFFDELESPMDRGDEIEIIIEIRGYHHNRILLAQLSDASISDSPPTLRITYKYLPVIDDEGNISKYEYLIYKGYDENRVFTHSDRQFINIRVINALRDVESELKNSKKSPIGVLLKHYEIAKEDLEHIAKNLKEKSDEVLALDEIVDLEKHINKSFAKLVGLQPDSDLYLGTLDFEPTRLLNTLKIMMGEKGRPISESSLGLNNILYISLVLLALEDKTIPTFITKFRFEAIQAKDNNPILVQCYAKNDHNNYVIKDQLTSKQMDCLYQYMDKNNPINAGFTILAIEEPESHLHPTLQRLIYKDVITNSKTSVLLTTHSTHITSVAPLKSIVHLFRPQNEATSVKSTTDINLEPHEIMDVERYIDANRGEIYFGKGVIVVEGIAEEYLIPVFADKLKLPLDRYGIVVCNINSTNFSPYLRLLSKLGIPYVVITDGDYYQINNIESKPTRKYHVMESDSISEWGYLGFEIIRKTLAELEEISDGDIPSDYDEQEKLFKSHSCHIGHHTLEIDIMTACTGAGAKDIIVQVFSELTDGGDQQKANFKSEILSGEYWKCHNKIEANGIGKGRFAQRFSNVCNVEHIPEYIKNAIEDIVQKVNDVSAV